MTALLAEDTEDDVDLFFRSIAKSVKKLSPALQQRAKAETLNVVTNLESQMWNSIPHGSSNFQVSQNFQVQQNNSASAQFNDYSDEDSSRHSSTSSELITLSLPDHSQQSSTTLLGDILI